MPKIKDEIKDESVANGIKADGTRSVPATLARWIADRTGGGVLPIEQMIESTQCADAIAGIIDSEASLADKLAQINDLLTGEQKSG